MTWETVQLEPLRLGVRRHKASRQCRQASQRLGAEGRGRKDLSAKAKSGPNQTQLVFGA